MNSPPSGLQHSWECSLEPRTHVNLLDSKAMSRWLEKAICFRHNRFPAKREQCKRCQRPLPESQGQNLGLTVLCVPYSLDSRALRGAYKVSSAPDSLTPEHGTRTLAGTRRSTSLLCLAQPEPETRYLESEIRNPKPVTRNPEFKPETRNLKPEPQNQDADEVAALSVCLDVHSTRTPDPKNETRNPKPET